MQTLQVRWCAKHGPHPAIAAALLLHQCLMSCVPQLSMANAAHSFFGSLASYAMSTPRPLQTASSPRVPEQTERPSICLACSKGLARRQCNKLCQSGFCHHSAPGNAGHTGSGSSASLNRAVSDLRRTRCWLLDRLLLRWLRLWMCRRAAVPASWPGPGGLGPIAPRVKTGTAAAGAIAAIAPRVKAGTAAAGAKARSAAFRAKAAGMLALALGTSPLPSSLSMSLHPMEWPVASASG